MLLPLPGLTLHALLKTPSSASRLVPNPVCKGSLLSLGWRLVPCAHVTQISHFQGVACNLLAAIIRCCSEQQQMLRNTEEATAGCSPSGGGQAGLCLKGGGVPPPPPTLLLQLYPKARPQPQYPPPLFQPPVTAPLNRFYIAPQPLCNCSELAPRAPSPSSKPLGSSPFFKSGPDILPYPPCIPGQGVGRPWIRDFFSPSNTDNESVLLRFVCQMSEGRGAGNAVVLMGY